MREDQPGKKRAVNPAARRDQPGEPHRNLAGDGSTAEPEDRVKSYQDSELDPKDHGGITE